MALPLRGARYLIDEHLFLGIHLYLNSEEKEAVCDEKPLLVKIPYFLIQLTNRRRRTSVHSV